MSKGVKEFWQQNKKVMLMYLVALGVLLLEFFLCRYAFFELHGMKEWPADLLWIGLAALVISLLARKQVAPWLISIGYFVWFWMGVIFNKESVDAHGTRGDTMPFIWLWGFLTCILAGFFVEVIVKWWKLLRNRK